MFYSDPDALIRDGAAHLRHGPLALIFVEDEAELDSTFMHALRLGFGRVVAFVPPGLRLAPALAARVVQVVLPTRAPGVTARTVNRIAAAAPGRWIYYGYNAEYLFFPFCETRSIAELVAFHAEERRAAMLTYVIDLYAGDLGCDPDGISLSDTWLDRIGYYAAARRAPDDPDQFLERQLDFFGGMRWRFEQFMQPASRRIDRVAIFQAQPGVAMGDDHTFGPALAAAEYNTYACPWHHNLTAAIASFRTAKALRTNPASRFEIDSFRWHGSSRFAWHSAQLMELGLMEPGQWF